MELVAADIGGTHARFAIAELAEGKVVRMSDPVTLVVADHAGLETAWEAFAARVGRPLPPAAALALATPIRGETLKMTNNPWVIRPAQLPRALGVERLRLINDFGAVGHAVQAVGADAFVHLAGPDLPLPGAGVISVIGPGTGLGVAYLLRAESGYHVVETEGGHIDYAPLDTIDDAVLTRLRKQLTRVSVERVVSGQGLAAIYRTLAAIEGRAVPEVDDRTLWSLALDGSDRLAAAAFDRFCLGLGAVAGDYALAHGAHAVVIAGGLGLRIADRLAASGFADRFVAKGRYRGMMETIPVKLITHPQPGLLGAAAAFAQQES